MTSDQELNQLERDLLAFERLWWQRAGAKDAAVRDLFGLTSTEYYRRLNLLIDRPAAIEHAPVVVGRLRRLREARAGRRRRFSA